MGTIMPDLGMSIKTVNICRSQALSNQSISDSFCNGRRDAQGSIHATARPLAMKDHHAWFIREEPAHEVVAHVPEFGELLDRIVPFERCLVHLAPLSLAIGRVAHAGRWRCSLHRPR